MYSKTNQFKVLLIAAVILTTILSACSNTGNGPLSDPVSEPFTDTEPVNEVELANPATVYCKEQGYEWELRTGTDGGQQGVCLFPDGSECDEWAYFRGECGPGDLDEAASAEAASDSQQKVPGKPVIAWTGHVTSTPSGSQFDDYLVLMPEGSGEIGVTGLNEEIEAEIVSLRDGSGADMYAIFWGELFCDVPDYGGCQLVVERILSGAAQSDPEFVENLAGMIVCSHFNSSPEDVCGNAFVLLGEFPVWYGIWSKEPGIMTQINALRDTGQIVVISGNLLAGVPDVNGTQIQVGRIDIYDR